MRDFFSELGSAADPPQNLFLGVFSLNPLDDRCSAIAVSH